MKVLFPEYYFFFHADRHCFHLQPILLLFSTATNGHPELSFFIPKTSKLPFLFAATSSPCTLTIKPIYLNARGPSCNWTTQQPGRTATAPMNTFATPPRAKNNERLRWNGNLPHPVECTNPITRLTCLLNPRLQQKIYSRPLFVYKLLKGK